jgi:hypothetical protein
MSSSFNGLKNVAATSIQNSGQFYLGNDINPGTAGQALVSAGPDEPARWDTHTGIIQPLTMGTNLSLASGNATFNGGTADTINATDTDTTYQGSSTINIDTTTDPDTISCIKVPNALIKGTNITFSSGTTYDGSSAITIGATDTDTQLNLTEGNGITITNTGGLNRTIAMNADGTTLSNNVGSGQAGVLKVPNVLTKGTNINFINTSDGAVETTYDGSAPITISSTDTDTTYQGGTGISIDTTTNPDTINCNNIPNSALANSTISGKALGSTLSTITFFQSDGTLITSYNGADPPTSVILDGDTTYQGGNNISIDTTTNPDTINLDSAPTNLDLSSATNTFPLFVGGSEILKSMSYIDNVSQNFNRIFKTRVIEGSVLLREGVTR